MITFLIFHHRLLKGVLPLFFNFFFRLLLSLLFMGSLRENEKRERVVSTYLGWRSGLTFLEVNKKKSTIRNIKKIHRFGLKNHSTTALFSIAIFCIFLSSFLLFCHQRRRFVVRAVFRGVDKSLIRIFRLGSFA